MLQLIKNKIFQFIIILFLFLPLFTIKAQDNNVSLDNMTSTSTIITVATVNIYEGTLMQKSDGDVEVNFLLSNKQYVQPGIRYAVDVYTEDTNGQLVELIDRKVYSETLVLRGGESVYRKLVYTPPSWLKGKYRIVIESRNKNALPLASFIIKKPVIFYGDQQYLKIKDSCSLVLNNEKYSAGFGVDLEAKQVLTMDCLVDNKISNNIQVFPHIEIYRRTIFGDKVADQSIKKHIILSSATTSQIKFNFTTENIPQSYEGILSLRNVNGKQISNNTYFRYVVRGKSSTISNFRLDKDGYSKGDRAFVQFLLSKQADTFFDAIGNNTSNINSYIVNVKMLSNKTKEECGEAKKNIVVAEAYKLQNIFLDINHNCLNPIVEVSLSDEVGEPLDALNTNITTLYKNRGAKKNSYPIIAIILSIVLFFGLLFIKIKNKKILFILFIICLSLSGGGTVLADTLDIGTNDHDHFFTTIALTATTYSAGSAVSYHYSGMELAVCGNRRVYGWIMGALDNPPNYYWDYRGDSYVRPVSSQKKHWVITDSNITVYGGTGTTRCGKFDDSLYHAPDPRSPVMEYGSKYPAGLSYKVGNLTHDTESHQSTSNTTMYKSNPSPVNITIGNAKSDCGSQAAYARIVMLQQDDCHNANFHHDLLKAVDYFTVNNCKTLPTAHITAPTDSSKIEYGNNIDFKGYVNLGNGGGSITNYAWVDIDLTKTNSPSYLGNNCRCVDGVGGNCMTTGTNPNFAKSDLSVGEHKICYTGRQVYSDSTFAWSGTESDYISITIKPKPKDSHLRVYDSTDGGVVALAAEDGGCSFPLRIRAGGATECLYLVDTTDSNASNVRIQTQDGIKAIRKLTGQCINPVANATLYVGDSIGVVNNTPWTYSSSNTSAKCEFKCNNGYSWSGSSCQVVTYHWDIGSFGACSVECGSGQQTRTVVCRDNSNNIVSDSLCSGSKPTTTQACNPTCSGAERTGLATGGYHCGLSSFPQWIVGHKIWIQKNKCVNNHCVWQNDHKGDESWTCRKSNGDGDCNGFKSNCCNDYTCYYGCETHKVWDSNHIGTGNWIVFESCKTGVNKPWDKTHSYDWGWSNGCYDQIGNSVSSAKCIDRTNPGHLVP